MNYKTLDEVAMNIAKEFKKCESRLLEIIIQVDRYKVYRKMGYPSLYQYVVGRLKLSEGQAYASINVARKSLEVPKLHDSIKNGKLSISQAKRITSVITKTNQDHWLQLAENSTQRKVEREVALANPTKTILEKMLYQPTQTFIQEKVEIKRNLVRLKLEMGLTEKLMLRLRRVQDIVSQKKRSSVSLEITLEAMVDEYLKKHDPVEKAKRQKMRGKLNSSPEKETLDKKSVVQNNVQPDVLDSNTDSPFFKSERSKLEKSQTINKAKVNLQLQQSSRKEFSYSIIKRKALESSIKHQVYLKSEGQCSAIDSQGKKCSSQRFLEIHHIKPLSRGGDDTLENLTLLCSGHHAIQHQDYS